MGRAPCCEKMGLKKGRWTTEEDQLLTKYIKANGEGSWRSLPKKAGLLRCGKSCRLRWINYLKEDLKRGNISIEEEETILKLRATFGNRWSLMAGHLPGRTDNEIKNYWNSHLSKKVRVEKKEKHTGEPERRKISSPRKAAKKKITRKAMSKNGGQQVDEVLAKKGEEEGGGKEAGGEEEELNAGVVSLEEIEKSVDWDLEMASRIREEWGEVSQWELESERDAFEGFGVFKDVDLWGNWALSDL
ncbi:hypothetical protein HPP92_016356 [Vanilla planifolia]|uniref:Uncharacterized protein n=1 Tax=Vanilla planifolia TaxID=51239 RepID=A0A835QJX3_VANPL|nr:hypothetical protein HPP92_016356 [Vanilla planifolia]